MKDEIGIMILSGCNPLLGVSKRAIEVLGNPKCFCLLAQVNNKQLAIIPGEEHPSAISLSQTSKTQDYYWIRGISVYRMMDAFGICGENKLIFFPAKHIPTENAIYCSDENRQVFDLESEEVAVEVRQFMSHNFHIKDRKNRTTPNALDIKCCKTTPRKKYSPTVLHRQSSLEWMRKLHLARRK